MSLFVGFQLVRSFNGALRPAVIVRRFFVGSYARWLHSLGVAGDVELQAQRAVSALVELTRPTTVLIKMTYPRLAMACFILYS